MSNLLPGTIIDGNFEVICEIGSGGMGIVYRAWHLMLQREVAIKVLRSEHNCGVEKLQRFRREAKIVSSLDHPNIVKVYAVGMVSNEQPYIAMEYLGGKQISEMIGEEGPFHWRKALPLFKQICKALECAHKMLIIHRDIKPSNILLLPEQSAEQYCVKLLDFGIAKSLVEAGPKLTQADMVVGSAVYLSPEQIQGLPANEHSDMYSLGCTFFEILTGQPPFIGDTVFETIAKQCTDAPPPMRQIYESIDCPADLEYVVQSMLRKDPLERPASMSAVLQMLDQIQKGERLDHDALTHRLPQKRLSRRIVAAVSIVLLIPVLWAVYTATGRSFGGSSAGSTATADLEAQHLGALIKDPANGNDKNLHRLYLTLVKHYKENQQHLEAQMVAEDALKRLSQKDKNWTNHMWHFLGEQYCATGLYDKALQCFDNSAQLNQLQHKNTLVHWYAAQGQWEKAAQNVQDQVVFFKESPTLARGPLIRWSTLALNGAGRYSEALPWARRNLDNARENRKPAAVLEARALLLDAEEANSKGTEYTKQFAELLAALEQSGGGEGPANGFISLARICQRNSDIRHAALYYKKAAKFALIRNDMSPSQHLRCTMVAIHALQECKEIARSIDVPLLDFQISDLSKEANIWKAEANDRTKIQSRPWQ